MFGNNEQRFVLDPGVSSVRVRSSGHAA